MDLDITRRIDSGAFGTVWLARDVLANRFCAVKFFDKTTPELASCEAMAQASAMCQINSPQVVQFYAVEEQIHPETKRSQLALIMEYVEGSRFDQVITDSLSFARASEIACDIVDGLAAIHESGLVHRDLGERNVIVTRAGAKIVDIYDRGTTDRPYSSENVKEDVRDLAGLVRQLLQRVNGVDAKLLAEAYYKATTDAVSVTDLRHSYAPLLPALESHRKGTVRCPSPARVASGGRSRTWSVTSAHLAPNGARVALGVRGNEGDETHLLVAHIGADGEAEAYVVDEGSAPVFPAHWSADSKIVAVSSWDVFLVFNVGTGAELNRGVSWRMYDQLALAPQGRHFAVASATNSVALFAVDGAEVHRAQLTNPHGHCRTRLAWSCSGEHLALNNDSTGVEIWARNGDLLQRIASSPDNAEFLWSVNGGHWGILRGGKVTVFGSVWELGLALALQTDIRSFSIGTTTIAAACAGAVGLWNLRSLHDYQLKPIATHGVSASSAQVFYNPRVNDELVVVHGHHVEIFDVSGGSFTRLQEWHGIPGSAYALVGWTRDGAILASGNSCILCGSGRAFEEVAFDATLTALDVDDEGGLVALLGPDRTLFRSRDGAVARLSVEMSGRHFVLRMSTEHT